MANVKKSPVNFLQCFKQLKKCLNILGNAGSVWFSTENSK